ncbi:unnamed protein product [Rotaria magnacalcarata]|uniref:Uncharacterized protein n=1 Tax=Rotaria magnacalcarata TaxID=392030 RepID=A0A816ZVK6_9BILA|nr:unnamed protein product [Rotaria magnacalcarata]CAF2226734.1 unnamed protein product [Rotaria magnacalcarata]
MFKTWIFDNLRLISIVEDSGLRGNCSYFYHLGTLCLFLYLLKLHNIPYCTVCFLFHSRKNGTRSMDLESLFQSQQTISRDITNQAQLYKEQLMELIKEPVQNQSLTNSRYQLSKLNTNIIFKL